MGNLPEDGDVSCAPTTPLGTEAAASKVGDVADVESSDLPSTSSSSSDSSDDDRGANPGLNIQGPVWRNKRSHVVHRCSRMDGFTACGTVVTPNRFDFFEGGCSSLNARCGKCFKGEVISTVSGLVEALDQQKAKRPRR